MLVTENLEFNQRISASQLLSSISNDKPEESRLDAVESDIYNNSLPSCFTVG